LLAGRDSTVDEIFPIRNIAAEVSADKHIFRDRETGQETSGRNQVHYYMDTDHQLRTWRRIEDDLGLDVIGLYHSHTHTEARPSPTDIRLAVDAGTMFYVLIGLKDRAVPEVRAWRILKADPSAETGELLEIPVANSASDLSGRVT